MIQTTLTFIKDLVESFINDSNVETYLDVLSKDETKEEGIYVSLLYFEEEKMMKNNRHMIPVYNKKSEIDGYQKVNPTIYLNLYVMIISNLSQYGEALKQISCVIEHLQQKNVFLKTETGDITEGGGFDNNGYPILNESKYPKLEKVVFEMETLTFEQNNSLWQAIGSKLYPYVIYKVKTLAFAQTAGENVPKVREEHLVFEVEASPNTLKETVDGQNPASHENGYLKDQPVDKHKLKQNKNFIYANEKIVKK